MKKDNIYIAITTCLICIILTFGLTVQMRTVNETDITSIENMREDELKEQAEIWKNRYEETQAKIDEDNKKITEYKEKTENNQEASQLLSSELTQMRTTLGKTDVEGEGIIITLSDGEEEVVSEDLLKLVNELKLAGAEAVSINEQRITNLTDIVDVSSYVLVNAQRINSPFEIKSIGDKQYLMSGISSKGGFSDVIKNDGKNISITQQNKITITKYIGELKLKTIKTN